MIPRYSRPEMTAIWSPETRFRIWFEIEAHACDALAEIGVIPKEAARTIWEKGGAAEFSVARIDEIERETKHDVIAFLTHLAEFVGPDARFIHQGMTSSDVLDTCLSVQLSRAADLLLADIDGLLAALETRGFDFVRQSPPLINVLGIVGLLLCLGMLSALTYGSVAALLAEMFPPQIRYSSMSIPYHIGAGYLGGFLPLISGIIVARTGDVYAGLWYTWAVVAFGVVVAWWGIPDGPPKDFQADA